MEYVKTVDHIIELNEKYTKERISLDNKLLRNDDLTIGEETITKSDIDKCEGKLLALQDLLEIIKTETGN
jgi:hypothetical protein